MPISESEYGCSFELNLSVEESHICTLMFDAFSHQGSELGDLLVMEALVWG